MSENYVILETGQGGGIPDTVHGPYWGREEAVEELKALREHTANIGRRDRYQLGLVEMEDES